MRDIPITALVYDFDHTLSPRDMQEFSFLPGLGIDPDDFWAACRRFALENSTDGILAYMYMMIEKSRGRMPLTRETLRAQGREIAFFPGVESWFDRINAIGRQIGVEVEHYIISSGLREIIEGSPISGAFRAIFASSFVYNESGQAVWPATAVNYTSKTQYLFRINKGILDLTNDRDLNAFTPKPLRRIPYTNMIYVGDGLTDVPCMKQSRARGGYAIAVHDPGQADLADDLLLQNRADYRCPADYRAGSQIERAVTLILRRIRAGHDATKLHQEQLAQAHESRGGGADYEWAINSAQ